MQQVERILNGDDCLPDKSIPCQDEKQYEELEISKYDKDRKLW